jgi:hypothetical protein
MMNAESDSAAKVITKASFVAAIVEIDLTIEHTTKNNRLTHGY